MKNDVIHRNLMKTAAHCAVSVVLCAAGATDQRPGTCAGKLLAGDGLEFSEDMLDFPALFGREAPVRLRLVLAWGRRWWQWLKIALAGLPRH